MIRFMEQTVGNDKTGKNALLYGICSFLSIFFLICAALCASGIVGENPEGGIAIAWFWIVLTLVSLALAGMAFFGRDYLRIEYDYSITESVVDVSRVLNNKRRKHLAEFDLGKVSQCGPASGANFEKAKHAPNIAVNKWFIHENAPLYYFCYENKGQRCMTVLELNEKMIELIKTDRTMPRDAWRDAEGKG